MSTYTQAQIDAFEQSMVDRQGARTFTFGDQTVTFGSYAEQVEFLAYMRRNLGSSTTPRTRYAVISKGV